MSGGIVLNDKGHPTGDGSAFQPISIEIDGKQYAVDFASLSEDDFCDNEDFTVDELMSN